MAVIRIDGFKGIAPAVSPIKLADGAAQIAENAEIRSTSLVAKRKPSNVDSVQAGTRSLYKWFNGTAFRYLTRSNKTSFVESPVANDLHKRIYMAGGAYPEYTTWDDAFTGFYTNQSLANNPRAPTDTYRLGVPAPTTTPTVVKSGNANADGSEVTTAYVYTYVTDFGEEGPPSPASAFITYIEGEIRTVTVQGPPAGDYAFGSGARVRLYRTATGNTGSEFLFAREVASQSGSFTIPDTTLDRDLGEVMPSTNWYRPLDDDSSYAPDGPLQQIVLMPGGFLAGYAGRVVAFSEQYLPHAWNPNNSLVTESDIVAIQDSIFGLVILTQTRPYVAVGSAPDVMGLTKLDIDQACVSADSVADLNGMVIYASPDGLVGIEGNQSILLTDGIITRKQWSAYNPSSMLGVTFEGRYYAFYQASGQRKALVFDPANSDAPFLHLDQEALAAHTSAKDDALYLIDDNDDLVNYNQGTTFHGVYWKSKQYFMPVDTTFSWARVIATQDVDISIYVDGSPIILGQTVTDSEPFRLPAETRGRVIEVVIQTADNISVETIVDSITLASERGDV